MRTKDIYSTNPLFHLDLCPWFSILLFLDQKFSNFWSQFPVYTLNNWGSLRASVQFSSVQSLSRVQLFVTPWIAARQASLSVTNSRSLLKTHVHGASDAIQPSHPLSSPSPPAPNPSEHQGLFQWVNSSHEVAKVLEFQLQHQSFQWTPRSDLLQDGLIGSPCSPRTLKSLQQHHSSKASLLQHSAFFTVQPHIHTWPLEKP